MLKVRIQTGNKWVRKPSQYRPFLWPGAVGLVVLLLSFWLVVPKIAEIAAGQKAVRLEKQKLVKITQKLASLEGLNEYELSTRVERVMKVLPSQKDLPGALRVVRFLVEAGELRLEEIKVRPGPVSDLSSQAELGPGEIPALTFEVAVNGSWEEIKKLLGQIKRVMPLMALTEVGLTGKEGVYQAKLGLAVFYLPLPSSLGSVESQLPGISSEEDKVYQSLSQLEAPSIPVEETSLPVTVGKENPFSF